jgi:TonB family protein
MPRTPLTSLAAPTSGRRRAAIFPLSVLLHAAAGAGLLILSAVGPAELPPVVGRTVISDYVLTPTVRADPPTVAPRPPTHRPPSKRAGGPTAPTFDLPAIVQDPILTMEPMDDPPALCLSNCDPVGVDGGSITGSPFGHGPASDGDDAGAGTAPVRVGGEIREPRRIHYVAPAYPEIARQGRIGGLVILDCVLDPQGRIASVQVLRGHPLFDGAAVDAVRQWRYEATRLNGVPIAVQLTVTVRFMPKS